MMIFNWWTLRDHQTNDVYKHEKVRKFRVEPVEPSFLHTDIGWFIDLTRKTTKSTKF